CTSSRSCSGRASGCSSASAIPRSSRSRSSPRRRSRTSGTAWNSRRARAVCSLMQLNLDALETSFDLVAPRGEELVEIFYARLFTAAPGVVPLFAGTDMGKQRTKLLVTLVLLRKSLGDLDAIAPTLRTLGR